MSTPEIEMTHEVYLAERRFAMETARDQTKFVDQSILSLAGGALGISLAFLHELVPQPVTGSCWLVLAWITLIACIFAVLIGLHVSELGLRRHLDNLDRFAKEQPSSPVGYKNPWAGITRLLNFFATFLLIVGISALAIFGYGNVAGRL